MLGHAGAGEPVLAERPPRLLDADLVTRAARRAGVERHPARAVGQLRAEALPRELIGLLPHDGADAQAQEAAQPARVNLVAGEVHPAAVVRDLEAMLAAVVMVGNLDTARADLPRRRVGEQLAHQIQRMLPLLNQVLEQRRVVLENLHFTGRSVQPVRIIPHCLVSAVSRRDSAARPGGLTSGGYRLG